jgi:DNA-binding MarR family transcriptional regulator
MRLARRMRQEASGGVTPSQLAVLGSLDRHGPMTLGELAAHERVQPPSITRTARALEESGLIARSVGAQDRRTARIELTSKARRLIQQIRNEREAWLAGRVAGLSAKETAELWRGLSALEHLLEVHP